MLRALVPRKLRAPCDRRARGLTAHRDNIATELRGKAFGMKGIASSEDESSQVKESTEPSQSRLVAQPTVIPHPRAAGSSGHAQASSSACVDAVAVDGEVVARYDGERLE